MAPGSGLKLAAFLLLQLSYFLLPAESQTSSGDADVMWALKKGLNPPDELGWSGTDPCKWAHVGCSDDKRVTRIQIGGQNLSGTLPPGISNLTRMERLELQRNSISGPLPSLSGLSSLQVLLLGENKFTSIPADFFTGMSSLITVEMDGNPFSPWELPDSLQNCSTLQNFSANSANITGEIPGFMGPDGFPGLLNLHLAMNSLSGVLPSSFSGLQIETLWVNGNNLSGGIDVLQNMTYLKQVWLHHNMFSGQLPDFSNLKGLEEFSVRDNGFTGPVPSSLVSLESLKVVNLTNNFLQGSVPQFGGKVSVDMLPDSNRFCLPKPGACDPRVDTLLSIVRSVGYPRRFADIWKGNDPCDAWLGITCNSGNITIVNFEKMGLTGTISPDFGSLKTLQRLILSNNNLTGTVPPELAALPVLSQLDVRNNSLYGHVPRFRSNMDFKADGNPDLGKDKPSSSSSVTPKPGGSPGSPPGSDANSLSGHKKSRVVIVILSVLGGIFVACLLGLVAFCLCKGRGKNSNRVQSPNAMIIHPRYSGSDDTESSVKITVAGSSVSVGAMSEAHHAATGETSDLQMVEAGNIKISIQVLRNVTNNFSEENILGRGGFGTVYKGALHDGTKIAVKRMESGVLAGKGLDEFRSEIAVLTKVRHRHLVALLGFCIDGNEKLLVYEYMPQGTLSRHLFGWADEGLRPLEWTKRLTIALDVARGVEYLHGLAQQSFIHRDLKPSNILLGDDMRAKVGDFGLVRLAPEGKASIETRLAGTFGYLAPEYAVTGRVSTKVDVFSFGVILMELITGRKALDETQPEESMHLVTWFRRVYLNKDMFRKAIDPTIDLTEEILASVSTVAELAGHCSAREPHQRPDMGHAVNVLSSLLDLWKPSVQNTDDIYGIDFEMSLPQALKKWQSEGRSNMDSSSSSYLPSLDNTQTSIPTRPYGFAESFTSTDGR